MKGLKVKLIISPKKIEHYVENDGIPQDPSGTEVPKDDASKKLNVLNLEDDEAEEEHEDTQLYQMDVTSEGKFTRKASWEDLKRFCGQDMNSDVFRDWILTYQEKCYPEDLSEPNHIPKKCYIKDENGGRIFKDFGWKPIKLNLKPGVVDVKERWTKEVFLESFPLDFSTNADKILALDKCDKEVISTLRKSKLAGHALAMEMMKTDSEIITEFKGMNSVTFGTFGTGGPSETDEETGDEVWKDVKTLRALLQDIKFPKRKGNSREARVDVIANEIHLKARVYYKAFFSNDVAADHEGKFRGKPFWKFPIKYLFQYNDKPNAILLYEDIELRFFTDVRLAMDNKDWDWVKDDDGRWKKQYNNVSAQ